MGFELLPKSAGLGAPAPQGLHWYYRVNRTGNRHCWFLDSTGTPVRLHKDLATSNLRSQVTAEQVLASPENDTVPTAPEQRATAETVAAETTAQEPSVRGRAATDFTARWIDLPKSVDLDAREFAHADRGRDRRKEDMADRW